ncbi:N-alpha-acetyltransferase 35 NatC auxiliary subunit [Allomyces javanicus]|nr:N-alpha-acetyltransferase 35 NatC auxiliary subunit [Allomyces javanicus]
METSNDAGQQPPNNSKEPTESFVDITQWLKTETNALPTGHVVRSDSFLMIDAMMAIEIMTPKMDAGLVTLEDLRTPMLDRVWVEATADRLAASEHGDRDITATMVALLLAETSFLYGLPLADTLFTCAYVQHVDALDSLAADHPAIAALRASIRGTIKLAGGVVTLMRQAGVYEDEDFSTEAHHFDLLPDVREIDIMADLVAAEKRVKGTDLAPLVALHRHALVAFSRVSVRDMEAASDAIGLWRRALETVRDQVVPKVDLGGDDWWAWGLNPRANRKLVVGCPPRNIKLMDVDAALDFWSKLTTHFSILASLPPAIRAVDILPLTTYLSSTPSIGFTAIPRALLQYVLLAHDLRMLGTTPFSQWVKQLCAESADPPYLTPMACGLVASVAITDPRTRTILAKQVDERVAPVLRTVFQTLDRNILDLLRSALHNPARQRRMAAKIFKYLDQTQAAAEEWDTQLQDVMRETGDPFYLTTFTYALKLRAMTHYIDVGSSLAIYAPRELPALYYHIDHLLSALGSALDRQARCATYAHLRVAHALDAVQARPSSALRKRAGKAKPAPQFAAVATDVLADPEWRWIDARRAMAAGMFLVLAVTGEALDDEVGGEGDTPRVGGKGYGWRLQYVQRFRALHAAGTPEPRTAEVYLADVTQARANPAATLATASAHLAMAHAHLTALVSSAERAAQALHLGGLQGDWAREHAVQVVQGLLDTCTASQTAVEQLGSYLPRPATPETATGAKKSPQQKAPARHNHGKKGGKKGPAGKKRGPSAGGKGKGKPVAKEKQQDGEEEGDEESSEAAADPQIVWPTVRVEFGPESSLFGRLLVDRPAAGEEQEPVENVETRA